ncbi:MAG: hypothetical protein HKK67_06710 [Chlorobiaceae bacterium]|nr:hypothetical protein [Chlorobiaceae bacterium]
MKERNNNTEEQVVKTMKLLDEIKPLEVNHFFRIRLMQRVEREFGQETKYSSTALRGRIDFRLAFMALLILINLGATLLSLQHNNRPVTSGISEMIDNLSDDYTSQELAYYDSTVTNDNQVP